MKADSSSFAAAPISPATTSVCVMGLGYIGLPTASILANKGYHVFGVDVYVKFPKFLVEAHVECES